MTSFAAGELIFRLQTRDAQSIAQDSGIFLDLQHETNPFDLEDTEEILKEFRAIYEQLAALGYDYYEIYQQPLLNGDSETLYGSDSSEFYSCVQISENVQRDFNLSTAAGRLLEEDDYWISRGKQIPVLLGSAYAGKAELGDVFSAEYLFSPFEFVVVGFLDPGSAVETSNLWIDLDEKLVIPSVDFQYAPESETEYVTQKIHAANKTSGKLRLPEEKFAEGLQKVSSVVEGRKVGEYSLSFSTYEGAINAKGSSLKNMLRSIVIGFLTALAAYAALLRIRHVRFKTGRKRILADLLLCFFAVGSSAAVNIWLYRSWGFRYGVSLYFICFCCLLLVFLLLSDLKNANEKPQSM